MSEAEARSAIHRRSQGVCERCGNAPAVDWHHRKNRSQGGLWSAANGLHLCRPCHIYVTEHPAASYSAGWLVPRSFKPRTIPTNYRGRWVFLDEDGGVTDMDGGRRHDVGW